MEIETLKDLKEALSKISDKVLENFGANFYEEEYIQLLCYNKGEQDIGDEDTYWADNSEKYPQLHDVNSWIENISKRTIEAKEKDTYGDYDSLVSSKDKIN